MDIRYRRSEAVNFIRFCVVRSNFEKVVFAVFACVSAL